MEILLVKFENRVIVTRVRCNLYKVCALPWEIVIEMVIWDGNSNNYGEDCVVGWKSMIFESLKSRCVLKESKSFCVC